MPSPNVPSAASAVQLNLQAIYADNGLKYSLLGYVIESLNHAFTDEDYERALTLLRNVVASSDIDLCSPCWSYVTPDTASGLFEYYPPLEYLCVLHKVRLGNDEVAEIIRSIARAGAILHPEMFQSSNMVAHAKRLLRLP